MASPGGKFREEAEEIVKFVLGFLPWILFLFLPTGGWEPLRRAVLVCLGAAVVFSVKALRAGFILQWATAGFFLFCAAALYGAEWVWLAEHMAPIANGFLAGTIWVTVLIGKPFTLQYARADRPRCQWYDEKLIRSCRLIAVFWGLLLLIPTGFNILRQARPDLLPERFYFWLSLSCIAGGIVFTVYYKRKKRRAA